MTRFAALHGGRRTQLRLPLSPLKAQMALQALDEWRQPADEAREQGWFKITNAVDGRPTVINIYDEISWWGISAQDFVDELAGISGAVEVHINSPGGDAFDGITIYNALAARDDVTTVCDGLAASAASVIYMAGKTRKASPGSMVMIHDALAMCIGNEADMLATASVLGKVSNAIASVYAAHTSTSAPDWRAVMVGEGWYGADEAVEAGLAHSLTRQPGAGTEPDTGTEPAATFDRSIFATWQGHPKAAAGSHEPMTGTHSHSHPAYSSQGGDASHDHEHSHDGDADHGHGHGDAPEDRGGSRILGKALAVHHTATVDEPWDGPAAVAAMPDDDEVLEYCHAWQDSAAAATPHKEGDDDADDQKKNYKFPHHKTKGGPANLAACRNGLARLSSADIPEGDEAGVRAHLQAHLDDGDGASDHTHTDLSGAQSLEQIRAALKGATA